jgi:hypothetical protein
MSTQYVKRARGGGREEGLTIGTDVGVARVVLSMNRWLGLRSREAVLRPGPESIDECGVRKNLQFCGLLQVIRHVVKQGSYGGSEAEGEIPMPLGGIDRNRD